MIFIERIKARTRAIYYRIVKRKSSTISMNSYIGNNVVLEGKNSIGLETKLENVSMGYGSYIANQSELSQCRIGRYCSIGSHVRLTIFYKGIMPSEKILDFPVDCNFLTGSVNL